MTSGCKSHLRPDVIYDIWAQISKFWIFKIWMHSQRIQPETYQVMTAVWLQASCITATWMPHDDPNCCHRLYTYTQISTNIVLRNTIQHVTFIVVGSSCGSHSMLPMLPFSSIMYSTDAHEDDRSPHVTAARKALRKPFVAVFECVFII